MWSETKVMLLFATPHSRNFIIFKYTVVWPSAAQKKSVRVRSTILICSCVELPSNFYQKTFLTTKICLVSNIQNIFIELLPNRKKTFFCYSNPVKKSCKNKFIFSILFLFLFGENWNSTSIFIYSFVGRKNCLT